jgi:flavodoxin I
MKSLILYSSQSGNTMKLAKAVYDSIEGEKDIYPIDEAPSLDVNYDLVAVGFWLQAGKPDPKTIAFLEKFNRESKMFLFATHGAAKGSDHAGAAMDYAAGLVKSAQIIGTFSCQGEVNPKALEKIKQKQNPPPWIKDADKAVGHPDASDLDDLVATLKTLRYP